jgi:hypothetical protein
LFIDVFPFITECIEKIYTLSRQFECADDVNMLGGSVHTAENNTEALVVASMEVGPEVNADKTKYRISRPIRRTFFSEKFDLNPTCVLCVEGNYYFQTYKYP